MSTTHASAGRKDQTPPHRDGTNGIPLTGPAAEYGPPLNLPFDRPRHAAVSAPGVRLVALIPEPLLAGMRTLSARERLPVDTLLLAAFHTLLHRYCLQDNLGLPAVMASAQLRDVPPQTVPMRIVRT